jgi:hypothetical protein
MSWLAYFLKELFSIFLDEIHFHLVTSAFLATSAMLAALALAA